MNGVAQYLNKLYEEIGDSSSLSFQSRIIFRGQANYSWDIVSSAGRRLVKAKKYNQNEFILYHVNLIENARKYGYGDLEVGSTLSDLEVLANIQHHGGATCLTDFTKNFLIALWMATEDANKTPKERTKEKKSEGKNNRKADGKVVVLDLGEDINFNNISYYNKVKEGDNIQQLLTKRAKIFDLKKIVQPRFWLWEPSKLNNRVIKQDSLFIFGLSAFPKIDDKDRRLSFKEIRIDASHKDGLRKELENVFGISAETVYYDVPGYSNKANPSDKPIGEKLLSTRSCLCSAKEYLKKEQYSIAINYLNDALSCKGGRRNCQRGREKCESNKGELLYWCGEVYEGIDVDTALLNYYQSSSYLIKLINSKNNYKDIYPLLCESYRKQSILCCRKNDYINGFRSNLSLYKVYRRKLIKDKHDNEEKEENGIDALFALLELSIFMLNRKYFKKILEYVKKEEKINVIGEILFVYLRNLGNAIFDCKLNLDSCFSDFDKIKKPTKKGVLVGYLYWNYFDAIKWLDAFKSNQINAAFNQNQIDNTQQYKAFIKQNYSKLILFVQKANETQNKWQNEVFDCNHSVNNPKST
jgi:hypothetical protein